MRQKCVIRPKICLGIKNYGTKIAQVRLDHFVPTLEWQHFNKTNRQFHLQYWRLFRVVGNSLIILKHTFYGWNHVWFDSNFEIRIDISIRWTKQKFRKTALPSFESYDILISCFSWLMTLWYAHEYMWAVVVELCENTVSQAWMFLILVKI